MQRKYSSGKFSFQSRKQRYKSRHRSGGINLAFLGKILEAFAANRLRFITIIVAVAAVITVVLVLAFAKPLETSAQDPVVENSGAANTEGTSEPESTSPPPVDTKSEGFNEVDTEKVDDDTLAGLTGEGLEDENIGDVSEDELKGAIGVVFDNVNSEKDLMLQKIERASATAKSEGSIGTVKFYNAKGDLNQQLQDMRSMINSNAKAIVIDVTDKETYIMMVNMAKSANIPVVAINAPASQGYMVNIVEDKTTYGQKSAEFLKQKLLAGNVLEIYGQASDTAEQQRVNLIKAALAANANIKSAGALNLENKSAKIKEAVNPLLTAGTVIDGVIAGQGMAKNVLNAFLANNIVPKVFCGDSTAGFIKMWHALKNEGITVEKPVEEEKKDTKKSSKPSPSPSESAKPETFLVKALGTEVFCSESTPYGIGGTAIQFALRFAEGKKLLPTALANNTYTYSPKLMITDENLEQYYQMFKDEADDYVISDWIPDADIDAMFEK